MRSAPDLCLQVGQCIYFGTYIILRGYTEHCLSYKVDTNVVAVKFGVLAEVKQVHTGDPVVCGNSKCTAVLNSYSVVDKGKKAGAVYILQE